MYVRTTLFVAYKGWYWNDLGLQCLSKGVLIYIQDNTFSKHTSCRFHGKMSENVGMWWIRVDNRPKAVGSDFRMVCNIARVFGPTTGKKYVFILAHMIMIMFTKVALCLLGVFLSSCRNDISLHLFFVFLFPAGFFWLNKAAEASTNFTSVLGGYLSQYVVWGIDFPPPTTLMKPLRVCEKGGGGSSSGNSSCADNFELSYLLTVQTRVNAQIYSRCLSPLGSISSWFCFQG